jgi:phosphate transport system substrate-binding protein
MKKTSFILALITGLMAPLSAQQLVIKGSDTLGAKLVPLLAEDYRAMHPGVSFEIAAEGSTTGIAAIIDGTAQIGMSSRRVGWGGQGRDLEAHHRGL